MSKTEKFYFTGFYLLTLLPGIVWLRSGSAKLIENKFPGLLKGILVKFASDNPYPFYKSFLENTAIPNALTLGYLVIAGELLTGLAILSSCAYILWKSKMNRMVKNLLAAGLIGGLFLNINFFLGGAWTNVSKEGLNILMIMLQAAALFFVLRLPYNH